MADIENNEIEARALGWLTEEERHGVNDHHGVVHPQGWWQPDWESAVRFSHSSLHFMPRRSA